MRNKLRVASWREDLALREMSWPEVVAYWNAWLLQAQSTNEFDAEEYSHGVMVSPREREALLREYDHKKSENQ